MLLEPCTPLAAWTQNDLLCLFSFDNKLWYKFLGKLYWMQKGLLSPKEIIRIMTGSRPRTSCKPLFQSLGILTVPSQYILSLMNFVLQNKERFTLNIEVHNFNTRNKLKLHKPVSSLTLYQKGVYNMSIRIFNKLPEHITNLAGNKKIFISTLRQYLVSKSLYSLEEFLND
jgi:hypothetical protein